MTDARCVYLIYYTSYITVSAQDFFEIVGIETDFFGWLVFACHWLYFKFDTIGVVDIDDTIDVLVIVETIDVIVIVDTINVIVIVDTTDVLVIDY
jgi:hypothetical protein